MRSTLVDASRKYVQGQLDLDRRDPASSGHFVLQKLVAYEMVPTNSDLTENIMVFWRSGL